MGSSMLSLIGKVVMRASTIQQAAAITMEILPEIVSLQMTENKIR